ncbi:unnamed protein product [Ophioblennius macclurei]
MWLHSVLLSIALSCCCSAELPGPPLIRLNAVLRPNQSDVVLKAGSAFNLSCHGNASLHLSSTAFVRLPSKQQLEVRKSNPRHTGTYRCGYTNQSLEHLNTWIHLYVTDAKDLSNVFVSSARDVLSVEQGDDVPVKCLLTDPTVTNLTLQSKDRKKGLPTGMNVTFDLRRGALIHAAMTTFNGDYVCSGRKDGKVVTSKPVRLLVVPRRQLRPPSVTIVQDEFVRLVGEKFELTCLSSNPSHFYTLSWTHEHVETLNATRSRRYDNSHLYMNSTIWISAVSQKHAGLYTCKATNDVGATVETARLRVLDRPYLKIHMQHRHSWIAQANNSSTLTRIKANATDGSLSTNSSAHSANVSSSREEAFEGQDVTLTFLVDSYPSVKNHSWETPKHLDIRDATTNKERYDANGYRSEFSLLLRRVHQEDRGQYSFHFANRFFNGSKNVNLRIYRPPSASVSQDGDILSCNGSGYPPPTIVWFSCHGAQSTCEDISTNQLSEGSVSSQGEMEEEEVEEEEEEVRTRLSLPPDDDDATIECEASNLLGTSRAVVRPPPPASIFTVPLIGALTTSAVLLLLLLVVVYKCKQKPRYEIRWKIIECTDGNNYTFIDPSQLPYDHEWEFPRDKLRLGAVLGSGAFGKVVEATAYGLGADEVTRVAVKMLKPSAHSEEREALMSELKILSHLGYHDNIVNLLGACTQGGPMLMITEYCRHGDLLNFLRGHAQDLLASMLCVDEGEDAAFYKNMSMRLRSDSGISCCSEYQDMKPGVQTDSLSVGDLLWFSYQVAQGLDFLSSRNCIHRDVAARNVLLTDGRVAKICDFGLARDIRNDDSYIVQGNARLPVKWMSPESIFQCVYTVQSDVWSYGVLLWEIFSLGRSPYPNVVVDTNFYKMIKDGRHMEQPDYAPAEIYQLMTLCWNLEPTDRPTFKTIGQLIHRLLPSGDDTLPQHGDQPTYKNIDECKEEDDEEDEEVGGATLKRGGEERGERREDQDKEPEPMMKNIYQRS